MALSSGGNEVTRQLFMWCISAVYLFAFFSLYTQIPGLYGPRGLAPVHNVLPQLKDDVSWISQFKKFPSLVIFHSLLRLPPSVVMELCCLVGGVLAIFMMVFRGLRCTLMFGILWILYLSLYKVGQVFLWFQWDILLLEAGFLTIHLAPLNPFYCRKSSINACNGVSFWLIRFLLFRLMFASGVVKLTSQCPTWWGLTALNYHYESQCIPTPLAWYAHQFPEWIKKLSVVAMYVIEIAIPLLFFMPVRSLRLLSFFSQVLLQILIIVTGNYNFFNILTIVLSISLLDDEILGYGGFSSRETGFTNRLLGSSFRQKYSLLSLAIKKLCLLSVCGLLCALTVFYFNVHIDNKNMAIVSEIRFSSEGFTKSLAVAVCLTTVLLSFSLFIEILISLSNVMLNTDKVYSALQFALTMPIVMTLFSVSLVSLGVLDNTFRVSIPQPITMLHDHMNGFSITNSYGLFRRMTGVGGRPEIVIEGSNEDPGNDDWKEYDFLYKPGDVYSSLSFVAPHQPRLDWQMWFAALGHYSDNPWLVNLVYQLLVGEKDVLELIGPPPFSSPPKYIRARLYHYHFTAYDNNSTVFNQWWRREIIGEYLYALTETKVKEYLNRNKIFMKENESHDDYPLLLLYCREFSRLLTPPVLLWCMFLFTLILSMVCMCQKSTM